MIGKPSAVLERYRDYDTLAWFYNRYWGREYPSCALPILEQLLLRHLPAQARILDLCCGTGHLTRVLAERGYRVTGIDGSAEMLRYAQENVPTVEFIPADARAFHLPSSFEGVLSTFESLNHIMDLADMELAFENVYEALKGGGLFVFDLLMEEAYQTQWNKSSSIVEEDNVCIVRGGYDEVTHTGRTDITMFRLNGRWHRSDVSVFQRCYSLGQIWQALEQAGFAEISCFDARRHLDMRGDLAIGRMFFRATKGHTL
jgi:SAM-dependent methyltransferase